MTPLYMEMLVETPPPETVQHALASFLCQTTKVRLRTGRRTIKVDLQ